MKYDIGLLNQAGAAGSTTLDDYKTTIEEDKGSSTEHYTATDDFYQRALLNSFNWSVGILITAIMIFRINK